MLQQQAEMAAANARNMVERGNIPANNPYMKGLRKMSQYNSMNPPNNKVFVNNTGSKLQHPKILFNSPDMAHRKIPNKLHAKTPSGTNHKIFTTNQKKKELFVPFND